jgi:AcrR family transcriptional regulator
MAPAAPVRPGPGRPAPVRTARGIERRERILESAARLIARRGFHAVGVTDIGAASGVTGAALYRHFANKSEILVALLDRVVEGLLEGARAIVAGEGDPHLALRTLIAAHVDFALADREILAVYAQEVQALPAADRRRLRATQRRYVDVWVTVLGRVAPGLAEAEARARVEAVFGLLNSVPNISSDIGDGELRRDLPAMAEAALLCRRPFV